MDRLASTSAAPFLAYVGPDGVEVAIELREAPRLTLGRDPACDIPLPWDASVSRTHAVLERLGTVWTIADDGISRNGTYLNAARLTGRRRLAHGDVIGLGRTHLRFSDPHSAQAGATSTTQPVLAAPVTPMQRRVLVALCRPMLEAGNYYVTPAANAAIAEELVLSVEAVKTHLRSLFERFEVGDLPQNQKRAKVAEIALRAGIVSERDL
jgi:pSer/pThr/pTyr-binding forkhead associated (FHA) protein